MSTSSTRPIAPRPRATTPARAAALAPLLGVLVAALVAFAPATARADGPPHLTKARGLMDQAKAAYNAENYADAARLYTKAAQVDPGAAGLKGVPYKNLARCMYWLGNYDKSVFWYNVYLRAWPKAKDHDTVAQERDSANTQRAKPDTTVTVGAVYSASVMELVQVIRERIDAGAPAYTIEGGGTAHLVKLAIDRGYALPELSAWSEALRGRLLSELDARWRLPDGQPLPVIGPGGEPLRISTERLRLLTRFGPTAAQTERAAAYTAIIAAWKTFFNEDYDTAATLFRALASRRPDLRYFAYAEGLAMIRAGDVRPAIKHLEAEAASASATRRPYYRLLLAEAYRLDQRHGDAAAVYLDAITQTPR